MKSNFCFSLFVPHETGSFAEQMASVEQQIRTWMKTEMLELSGLLQSRVYLSDAANQWESVRQATLYTQLLSAGAVSYIEQPLLNGSKIAVQLWCVKGTTVTKQGNPSCMKMDFDGVSFLFQSVRFAAETVESLDANAQTQLAFRQHCTTLDELGWTLERNCQRTWLYVRDIDRHYAGVVQGRNAVFAAEGLTAETHYIASTGIEGYTDNRSAVVAVDFFSVDGLSREDVQYLHALDYLNPTHEYGVAFERGTRLQLPTAQLSFISGTASIDKHGECLHRGDVLTQTGRLFLNIEQLLKDGGAQLSDVAYMIVYLRDVADYAAVDRYLSLRFPHTPYLITSARVCRPEWLIEVECIAQQPR